MIDTIKIFTNIQKNVYDIICHNAIVKTSYQTSTGEILGSLIL